MFPLPDGKRDPGLLCAALRPGHVLFWGHSETLCSDGCRGHRRSCEDNSVLIYWIVNEAVVMDMAAAQSSQSD